MERLFSRCSRRAFAKSLAAGAALFAWPRQCAHAAPAIPAGMTMGIGNYGMPAARVEEAIQLVAETGFDSLELTMMPDWDSSPEKLGADRRRSLRQMLADSRLILTSLMEDLTPSPVEAEQQAALDRLKRAAELGGDLAPDRLPLIQTVLGGGRWEEKRTLYRDCLGDWLRIAESHKVTIAVKPHRSGAMSLPAEAAWLYEQLGRSPCFGMVYDHSHYAFRDLSIEETVKTALPITRHIAVKDVVRRGERFEFSLPGEAGTIDHSEILKRFFEGGYRGDVCCEVSSQVFRRSDYDPPVATRHCYNALRQLFEKGKIPRRN